MTMRKNRSSITAALLLLFLASLAATTAASPWGANYFPNIELTTQDGEKVRCFDDLIKDKIVVVNFIYTTCPDTCPVETAQLVKVQQILGDRLGKDVFFYSITIDPKIDTPKVLKEYKERFRADWTFLTGNEADIIELRKKLGLYIPEIQDGSKNHNVNMIIGNQRTGRWMKRSPMENPYVLADQIGNWLTDWKAPPKGGDYADAPALRKLAMGEQVFRTRCATCHSLTGTEPPGALGPDLLGVTERRERDWLLDWLRAPDAMLAKGDPIATALYERYNRLAMPNMRLNKREALETLSYIAEETQRLSAKATAATAQTTALGVREDEPQEDVVAIMNAWVREALPGAKSNAGYMTLINVGEEDVRLVAVHSNDFERVEVHEMTMVGGLMQMREIPELVVPSKGQVQLAPGGMHLMLIGPRGFPTKGKTIDLNLRFESGRQQTVSVQVASR